MIIRKNILGRQTVAYDPGAKSLTVYGGGYRFYPDGTVERLDLRYEDHGSQ